MRRDAVISTDGLYRYRLTRSWGPEPPLVWIMLNPSTADALVDDPTIRRCVGFAHREGAGGIEVLNLFAYRSSSPRDLARCDDPVGPENDDWIARILNVHKRCVCAWGAYPAWERAAAVMDLSPHAEFLYLGRTGSGAPRHPLYVPANAQLGRWAA